MKKLALFILAVPVIFCSATSRHSEADWTQTDSEIQVILSVDDEWIDLDDIYTQTTLSMSNPAHEVKAFDTYITSSATGCTSNCDVDYLTCTGCVPDRYRAPEYICYADDLGGGKCRILMVSLDPIVMIEEGNGPIATIDFTVSYDLPSDICIDLMPTGSQISDPFNDPLHVSEESGELCLTVCGDVYPADCFGQCECGDSVVDIFDILETVDFVLGVTSLSDCQLRRADVPTGSQPYCSKRDGIVDIFDILVLINKTLGKANCCDDYNPCVYC